MKATLVATIGTRDLMFQIKSGLWYNVGDDRMQDGEIIGGNHSLPPVKRAQSKLLNGDRNSQRFFTPMRQRRQHNKAYQNPPEKNGSTEKGRLRTNG
jgi:hypothetical protein